MSEKTPLFRGFLAHFSSDYCQSPERGLSTYFLETTKKPPIREKTNKQIRRPEEAGGLLYGESEGVDCRFNLFRNVLGNELLGDDEIENLTAGLLVEELDGIFHQVRGFFFDNRNALGIRKAVFHGHGSEIHDLLLSRDSRSQNTFKF